MQHCSPLPPPVPLLVGSVAVLEKSKLDRNLLEIKNYSDYKVFPFNNLKLLLLPFD